MVQLLPLCFNRARQLPHASAGTLFVYFAVPAMTARTPPAFEVTLLPRQVDDHGVPAAKCRRGGVRLTLVFMAPPTVQKHVNSWLR